MRIENYPGRPTAAQTDAENLVMAELVDGVVPALRNLERPATFALVDLFEILLKQPATFDSLSRFGTAQRILFPRLLAIGTCGYLVFGLALSICLHAAKIRPVLAPIAEWLVERQGSLVTFESSITTSWLHFATSSVTMTLAYGLGMIGAIGICLPSFYFYGLLAGVRTTWLHTVVLSLKGLATGSIALLGILPIYVAIVLALVVFPAPPTVVTAVGTIGLILPFVAGGFGTFALYTGMAQLSDTMKPEFREARQDFLFRMLFSWSACFTAICPVLIYTLWGQLDAWLTR